MFLRWMWLKKQAAIPYCVSRSCHLFLLRKRETVWLATRNTDHGFIQDRSLFQAFSQLLKWKCLLTLTTCSTAAVRLVSAPGAALGGASVSGSADPLTGTSAGHTLHTGGRVALILRRSSCVFVLSQVIYLLSHSEEDWPKTPARNTVFWRLCL